MVGGRWGHCVKPHGVNEGVFEAMMAMLSPVRGLGSRRAGHDPVEKVPKPAIRTVSPWASASAMVREHGADCRVDVSLGR